MSKYHVHQLDSNHRDIVAALEAGGFSVESLGRPVDIAAGKDGKTYLFEIKTAKGKLRISQQKFFARWRGHAAVLRSVEDVLAFQGSLISP
jgi:hypothetical protein